ncbi:DUF1244 domain-containing protein [Sphingosinicella rhizophila]|uniref:DUF1244 domain-containing protein n=1 Tax=Sphingosinicella rhizophila TaxID=3050082 RepID=A0ABU3Q902_9SPHN|nr:DUF1244 domain-containing protein [Sphingosinicella sp. GR2756]MDT9599883.1 DUF1244 domain-containing protein [Sphingosinicella sp. GR2756]
MNRADIDQSAAASAFWRLIDHLGHRSDAQNVELMGLAGFCRNCLADWLREATEAGERPLSKDEAREAVYGMPYEAWKEHFQQPASPEQLTRMKESVARNPTG